MTCVQLQKPSPHYGVIKAKYKNQYLVIDKLCFLQKKMEKRKSSIKPVKPITVLVNFTSISLIYLENTFATP